MATTSTSDSRPWRTRRVRERRLAAGGSWSTVTAAALPQLDPMTSPGQADSSCLPGVQLQSPLGALAECLLEHRAAGEPQHLRRLASELPIGVGRQVQPAGDTTTGELVIPGGGEPAGARLDPLVVPHARPRRR